MKHFLFLGIAAAAFILRPNSAFATGSIQGTYQAVLEHDLNKYYQYATITLRTINPGDGNLKISANVRIYFGEMGSNEFLSYEYPDCPLNILTRQISLKNPNYDVSFLGYLRGDGIEGEWFSPVAGRVGKFGSSKTVTPDPPAESKLVRSVTGHYVGRLTNTGPNSNLPESVTMSLVTTQDPVADGSVNVSGNLRFYLGAVGSTEFIETKFEKVQFNFYNRYLTAKTEQFGMAIRGTLDMNGTFKGQVFAEGMGQVATMEVSAQ